jgi:acetoin utilization deacetylase AcuC-like enzyme
MSSLMLDLAREVCAGRLVMLQEGGYSVAYVPYCTVSAIEPLLGVELGIVDPNMDANELEQCASVFSRATREALAEARDWHKHWWEL